MQRIFYKPAFLQGPLALTFEGGGRSGSRVLTVEAEIVIHELLRARAVLCGRDLSPSLALMVGYSEEMHAMVYERALLGDLTSVLKDFAQQHHSH